MVLKCSQNKLKYHFRKIIKLRKQKFIQHNLKCIFLLQQLGGFFTCTDVYFKKSQIRDMNGQLLLSKLKSLLCRWRSFSSWFSH